MRDRATLELRCRAFHIVVYVLPDTPYEPPNMSPASPSSPASPQPQIRSSPLQRLGNAGHHHRIDTRRPILSHGSNLAITSCGPQVDSSATVGLAAF
jgi:hypothetical protein